MAKLIFHHDTLFSAILDSPAECDAATVALGFAHFASQTPTGDQILRAFLHEAGADYDTTMAQVASTLGQLRTEVPEGSRWRIGDAPETAS